MLTVKGFAWLGCFVAGLLMWVGILLVIRGCNVAETPQVVAGGTILAETTTYTLNEWADAIRKAENNPNYGIISIPCDGEAQCRQYCKNTVYNTLIKYRKARCKPEWSDLKCLANRYCPVGSYTDDGTCVHWEKNVKWFLNNA